jgi:T4-like virus tail tube protein gp19
MTITSNKNPLAISDGFRMVFHRAPNVSYFCQNFIMPSVTVQETLVARPQNDVYYPGDKIQYEPLTVTMLVAENMENYMEVIDWLNRSVKSLNSEDKYDDVTVYILSSKNNANAKVVFHNAFPTNIGSISFNVQDADITYAQVDVTFRYDYFTFESYAESTTKP